MSPSTNGEQLRSFPPGHYNNVAQPHRSGQKVRFENEEAEIIRISPFLIIKTKDRIVCGALHHRIEYLAA